jgi:3-methyl-2-oxobutanoate hydroxymethyltransferase
MLRPRKKLYRLRPPAAQGNAGAYAAELEVVPHNLARFLSAQTKMILMSLGSGPGCDRSSSSPMTSSVTTTNARHATRKPTAFSPPNTATCSRERMAAFREYIAAVHVGRFPERDQLVEMEARFLDEVARSIGAAPSQIVQEVTE